MKRWVASLLWVITLALGSFVLATAPVRPQAKAGTPPPASAPLPPPGSVTFAGQALFTIQAPLATFSPQARAQFITERLERLSADPFTPTPALQLAEQDEATEILCGDTILMTLTDQDAQLAHLARADLARERMATLQDALRSRTWIARLKAIAFHALWTLLATAVIALALWLIAQGAKRIRARILALPEGHFRGLRIQELELVSFNTLRRMACHLVWTLQTLVALLIAYLYFSTVFSFFPATRGLAYKLLLLLLTPIRQVGLGILGYLPSLFFLLVIGVVTRFLLKGIHLIFRGIQAGSIKIPNFYPDWAEPSYRMARFFILAFALVVAFPYLPGAGSEGLKNVSLFLGVIFSLGSSGAVSNAVAGVLITYMRPFHVGDRIAVGETVGDVVEKSMLVTRIRTIKNVEITIPNATLLGSQVQNFSAQAQDRGLILHTTVTIGYDAPWRQVHALLIEAAQATEGILREPAPFVLQTSLDDFYVSYQLNAYTREASRQAALYSQLHANIQEHFNRAGVEIMSPHYRAARDGNQSTIPADQLPEGYQAPGFRVTKLP
nr:mechanosensitive ion channel family protein [uncultured Holophaga sp.]